MEPKFFLFTRTLSLAKAIVHCTLQGVFIPLLSTFWTSKRKDSKWFKGYVLYVNSLALLQTLVEVLQAFYAAEFGTPHVGLIPASPFLTAIMAASIQGFFIFRCWNIFKQRLLPIIPLLVLCTGGLVSGILVAAFLWKQGSTYESEVTTGVWIFSSFALDLSMTTTTVVFLYRSRTGLREHDGVFKTIWQVTWASAIPPLLVMIIPIVDRYIAPTPKHAATFFALGISGKFFVLSLMINLVGRGCIREKLEQAVKRPRTLDIALEISAPVFVHGDPDIDVLEARHSLRISTLVHESSLAAKPLERSHHNKIRPNNSKPETGGRFSSLGSASERPTSSI